MSGMIDFYFDYTSPYGYLASERIEALAARHDRELAWHPILLGAIFKTSGGRPLTEEPLKGPYSIHDMHRSAREHAIPFSRPEPFPIATVAACRATLWLREHDGSGLRERTAALIHALYRAYFRDGRDISGADTVLDLAAACGVDREALARALGEQALKDRLRAGIETAVEHGVFGSPTFVVDGEMFWGHDRLEMLERWLDRGGW